MRKSGLSLFLLAGATSAAFVVTACDDGDAKSGPSKSSTGVSLGQLAVDTRGDLPACNASTESLLAYLRDESKIVVCVSGEWKEVVFPSGAKGDKGDQGATGDKGATGDAGATGDKGSDGANGSNGAKGANGSTGAKGDQGDPGARGIRGEPGDVGVAGAKGANGSRGAKGDVGERGFTGEPGEVGAKGDKGDQGEAGLKGERGFHGDRGEVGAKGDKGETGDQGVKGDRGIKGQPGDVGAKGDQGDKGDTGIKGDQGAVGIKGQPGDVGAKGDQGDKGDIGIQGEPGNVGAKGDKGDTGAKGDAGEQGDNGDKGSSGAKGDDGDAGAQGDKGATGDQGDAGAKGETGDKGDKGEKGAPGLTQLIKLTPIGSNNSTGHCSDAGGYEIAIGFDTVVVNGKLDESEVTSRAYVCGGGKVRDRIVFVTQWTQEPGTVRMVSCQYLAEQAGLSGIYMPWLSYTGFSPAKEFTKDGRFVLLTGAVIADSWDQLTTGPLYHAIDHDEFGAFVAPTSVWTGTENDGTPSGYDGNSWLGGGGDATFGSTTSTTNWSAEGVSNYEYFPMFCFQQ